MKTKMTVLFAVLGLLVSGFLPTGAQSFELITRTEVVVVEGVKQEIVKTADNFIILFDSSSSMEEPYKNSGMTKIKALKKALSERNQNMPDLEFNAGLYTFSPTDNVYRSRRLKAYYKMGPYNKAGFARAIDQLPDKGAGPTMLQYALKELDEILATQQGSTVVFVVTDGKFSRDKTMKQPVEIARDLAAKHNVSFYVISNASGKMAAQILKAVASIDAYSRVIPFDYLMKSPANLTGALFVVEDKVVLNAIAIEKIVGAELKDIRFDFAKSEIRSEYFGGLNLLGKFLQANPQTYVVFSGFTDSVGSTEYNLGLSRRRAESVGMYLTKQFGIDSERIALQWYGPAAPAASNATAEGRSQNRRVKTIVIGMP